MCWLVFWILHALLLPSVIEAGIFCGDPFRGFRYCSGLTSYCCGLEHDLCCWDSVWRMWWFWILVFVIACSIISCLGYFCTKSDNYSLLRSDSFVSFRNRFRRSSSQERAFEEEIRKREERSVLLPPYSPPSNTVPMTTSSAIQPPYTDPPPPYNGVVSSSPQTSSRAPSSESRAPTSNIVPMVNNPSTVRR